MEKLFDALFRAIEAKYNNGEPFEAETKDRLAEAVFNGKSEHELKELLDLIRR